MVSEAEMSAARAALAARSKGAARIGGKGSVRRKKKVVHKTSGADASKLQNALKRLNVNQVGSVSEVQMFLEDETVMCFNQPKVQANISANTYVATGGHTIKPASEVGGSGGMDMAELQRLMAMQQAASQAQA